MNKRQEALIAEFIAVIDEKMQPVYRELIDCMDELGYAPAKERSHLVFKCKAHNKQLAKIGFKKEVPFFALRFSACRGYSDRIAGLVADYIAKNPTKAARCPAGNCDWCKGMPQTHVYTDGVNMNCGAAAIEIENLSAADVDELKKMICEEHEYLMRYEA